MRPRRATTLLALAVCLAGCAEIVRMPMAVVRGGPTEVTESELHASLAVWGTTFASLIGATADQIRKESRDRNVRRNAVLWQIRIIPLARLAAFQADPQSAYVASLALSGAQHEYLSTGEGRALFGAQQALAVDAANRIEQEAIDLGHVFLSDRQLARLREQVDELVAQHPIHGTFAAEGLISSFADPQQRQNFTWVTDLPMAPFRALSGVSDTAQAVQNFNETAREFTAVVNQLPQLSRWQLELLLYDAEELEAVERALAAAEGLASAAGTLPEELGTEMEARLRDAQSAVAELDAALARAQSLSEPLTHVADRVAEASAQWTALLTAMRSDDSGDEGGRPFDVREYESAAAQIAETSRGIRELVAEINALDASGATGIVDRAAGIVDRATWRAALLIVVFFASLAGYRVLVARLRRA